MFEQRLVMQSSDAVRHSAIFRCLVDVAASVAFGRLRVAVAYATYAGCRDLVATLAERLPQWGVMKKRWLISMDFGRTEPRSLTYLAGLPQSEVRVPDMTRALASHLAPRHAFHPKTFILDSSEDDTTALAVFSGSANLTLSGLHSGTEHGISLLFAGLLSQTERSLVARLRRQLRWWTHAWDAAEIPTGGDIVRYGTLRPKAERPEIAEETDVFRAVAQDPDDAVKLARWSAARFLWVGTRRLYRNRGRGKPGNQLDLPRGARVYFGIPPAAVPPNTVLGTVTITYDLQQPTLRSVRYGDNHMDKVNLPIPGVDGPPTYDDAYLRFERLREGVFRLTLSGAGQYSVWRRTSLQQGMLYQMAGGREYGLYS